MNHKVTRTGMKVKAKRKIRPGEYTEIVGKIVDIQRKFEDYHESFIYQIEYKNEAGQVRYIWIPDYRVRRLSDGESLTNLP